jgi:hypothetical protein
MSKRWKEVARLGGPGARYPQVLVDAHGWCLRLGRHSRHDQKYYSTLPSLLGGLIEHTARRRLMDSPSAVDLQAFLTTLKASLETARSLCQEAVEKGGLEEHVRRQDARKVPSKPRESILRLCEAQNGLDAELPARRASSAS